MLSKTTLLKVLLLKISLINSNLVIQSYIVIYMFCWLYLLVTVLHVHVIILLFDNYELLNNL